MGNVVFKRRNTSRLITRRRLDFNHIGAHVREQLRAMQAEGTGDVEDAIAGERPGSGDIFHEFLRAGNGYVRPRFLLGRYNGVKARSSFASRTFGLLRRKVTVAMNLRI